MPLPTKERTRTSDLVLDAATETALTTRTSKPTSTKTNMGPLAMLAAGVLGLATVVAATAESAVPEPEQNLKLRILSSKEVSHLPRAVTAEDHWPIQDPVYIGIGFKKAINQPELIVCLSKTKVNLSTDVDLHIGPTYLHYPDAPVPNPLFEGGISSFQALGDAIRRRLELVPGLETTVQEVMELVEKLGDQIPAEHKEILFAPVESYIVAAAPEGMTYHRTTTKTAAFIVVGQNKYNSAICNDFPMIHCLDDGQLSLTWGNDPEARTAEGVLTDRLVSLEKLIERRIHQEWKDRYRIQDKEEAVHLAQHIAKHIWMSIPSAWKTPGKTTDSIQLPDSGLTFTLTPSDYGGYGGYHLHGERKNRTNLDNSYTNYRDDVLSFKLTHTTSKNPILRPRWYEKEIEGDASIIEPHLISSIAKRFTDEWAPELRLSAKDACSLAQWIYDQHIKRYPNQKLL